MKYTFGLQFSYWTANATLAQNVQAEDCGQRLKESLRVAMDSLIRSELETDNASVKLLSSTQVSLPRLRHCALAQEPGCFAAGDVVVVSVSAPTGLIQREESVRERNDRVRRCLHQLWERTNRELRACTDGSTEMRLDACKLLPSNSRLHAERSCTQRVFHYLMPLSWLPDGDELERWYSSNAPRPPPPGSLRALKAALRGAESPLLKRSLTKDEADKLSIKSAAGRFGNLSERQRLPWHNFADPNLRGDASPNNEPVWRVLDRARIVEVTQTERGQAALVLEFRGDDFLPEQVRRIVGTAVAVTHGWLPKDILETSRQADSFLETPVAPMGRLYLAESRFHFDELSSGGQSIFRSDNGGPCVYNQSVHLVSSIQRDIVSSRDSQDIQRLESNWLSTVKDEVAPRIRQQLLMQRAPTGGENSVQSPTREIGCYKETLELLREIVAAERWPETSVARSSVIGNVAKDSVNAKHKKGSFTVVNPDFQNGLYGFGIGEHPLPLANALFPDLTKAVFELERSLAEHDLTQVEGEPACKPRPPSSHCAVNCNAQFTPHVDSGRGAGQSLSMIVGFGDYSGGQLAVEGEPYDIRFVPLEFDGWRLRHWTLPFAGERFSLVWFTPDIKISMT